MEKYVSVIVLVDMMVRPHPECFQVSSAICVTTCSSSNYTNTTHTCTHICTYKPLTTVKGYVYKVHHGFTLFIQCFNKEDTLACKMNGSQKASTNFDFSTYIIKCYRFLCRLRLSCHSRFLGRLFALDLLDIFCDTLLCFC